MLKTIILCAAFLSVSAIARAEDEWIVYGKEGDVSAKTSLDQDGWILYGAEKKHKKGLSIDDCFNQYNYDLGDIEIYAPGARGAKAKDKGKAGARNPESSGAAKNTNQFSQSTGSAMQTSKGDSPAVTQGKTTEEDKRKYSDTLVKVELHRRGCIDNLRKAFDELVQIPEARNVLIKYGLYFE